MTHIRDKAMPVTSFTFETSRRGLLGLGGAGLTAWLLASCSNNSSNSPSNSESAGTPKKGGTLRMSFSDASADDSLDPGRVLTLSSQLAVSSIFDQLATVGDDYAAVPALAESWDVAADASKWTLHLRKGVTWHDGSPFTSQDVLYTMSRWFDPDAGNATAGIVGPYFDMDGVSAPDDSTVVIKLTKPNGVLLQLLAVLPYATIVKDGTTEFNSTEVVGTGPYKLTDWSPGQGWKAVRNDDYWGGAVYVDGIELKATPDQGAKLQGVLASSTDLTDVIPTSLWATLDNKDNVALDVIENRNIFLFAFDQTQKPFDDERVIAALKLATNRDEIVKTAFLGNGTVLADVPIDPTTEWYPKDLTPEFDPDKAKSLLAEAGYPDGLDIDLSVSSAIPGMGDVAQVWQQGVKAAGINVTLNQFGADTWYSEGWMATPAFMDYLPNFFPPLAFDSLYTAEAAYPYTHFVDPELEELVPQVFATTDEATAMELTQQAFLVARDSFGLIYPAFSDSAYARSSKVNGVIFNPTTSFDLRKVWLA